MKNASPDAQDRIIPDADPRTPSQAQPDFPAPDRGHVGPSSPGDVREGEDANFAVTKPDARSVCVLFKGCADEHQAYAKESLLSGYGLSGGWDRISGAVVEGGFEVVYDRAAGLPTGSGISALIGEEDMPAHGGEEDEDTRREAEAEARKGRVAPKPMTPMASVDGERERRYRPSDRRVVGGVLTKTGSAAAERENRVSPSMEGALRERRLTYREREHMPASDFAMPGKRMGGKGGYPDENISHGRAALSRVAQHGTPSEKRRVHADVCRKFPSISSCRDEGQSRAEVQGRAYRIVERLIAEIN